MSVLRPIARVAGLSSDHAHSLKKKIGEEIHKNNFFHPKNAHFALLRSNFCNFPSFNSPTSLSLSSLVFPHFAQTSTNATFHERKSPANEDANTNTENTDAWKLTVQSEGIQFCRLLSFSPFAWKLFPLSENTNTAILIQIQSLFRKNTKLSNFPFSSLHLLQSLVFQKSTPRKR